MKCPFCLDADLIWGNDFDLDEGEVTDKDGEPFTIQSFYNCPECMTQVCIYS